MAPNKKGGKKKDDDWEADLGETIDPIAAATEAAKADEVGADVEEAGLGGGGGLMAAIKKNKNKKQKRRDPVEESIEGQDALESAVNGSHEPASTNGETYHGIKVPEEADSAEEEIAPQSKKGKPLPQRTKPQEVPKDEKDVAEEDEGEGRLKSKKEKEKEKKEREKQRKKEQVCISKKRVRAPTRSSYSPGRYYEL